MGKIVFDVNDSKLRESFLRHDLIEAASGLDEKTPALWGNMTPQHMIEHLTWAFQCSTGSIVLPCPTPGPLLERIKRFLYDNRETPHLFRNPALGDSPPALQFRSLADAKTEMQKELIRFLDHVREHPESIYGHPIFGPLGVEEWQRSHYKHCFHHLLQFGLIE